MATNLNSGAKASAQGLFVQSASQEHILGEIIRSPDGRVFRYVKAGAVDLVVGKLQQSPAEITNHQNLAVPATAALSTTVTVTLGATAVTANQYAGGYAIITATPGVGYQYLIKSHPAASGGATCVLTLEDPIQVALTTSSKIDLVANPYNGVIVNPTTATGIPVGVAISVITAGYYGWIQTGGIASVLASGALGVGNTVSASVDIAGAVKVIDSTSTTTIKPAVVGEAATGVADQQYGAVKLLLD